MSRVMQKQELMALKLKGSKYPDNFGTNILHLDIEYKHTLIEEEAGAAGPKYAHNIFNKIRMIESKDDEFTCEDLLTQSRRIWRMSRAGKDADLKEKELSLADLGPFANGKNLFHYGSTEHMKH
jgi:hypothetical protein